MIFWYIYSVFFTWRATWYYIQDFRLCIRCDFSKHVCMNVLFLCFLPLPLWPYWMSVLALNIDIKHRLNDNSTTYMTEITGQIYHRKRFYFACVSPRFHSLHSGFTLFDQLLCTTADTKLTDHENNREKSTQ